MERLEHIRKLPKKELIKFLVQLLNSEKCDSCPILTHCRRGEGINCNTAFRLYLESEMAPLPKLQKGDLIEFGSGKEVVYFENDFVWDFLDGNGVILINMAEVDYKRIVSVKRVNDRKQVNVIWQGGM